jgi:hypothetical protein
MESRTGNTDANLGTTPDLSAILPMSRELAHIRKTIAKLCRQTARQQLELIIVTTPDKTAQIDRAALNSLGWWRVVTVPSMPTLYVGWAAGVRHATAPVVVICEDHCFPEPGWAQALIEAHRG